MELLFYNSHLGAISGDEAPDCAPPGARGFAGLGPSQGPPRGGANLLLKMKRQEGKTKGSESLEATAEDLVCHDIIENTDT